MVITIALTFHSTLVNHFVINFAKKATIYGTEIVQRFL